MSFIRGLFIIVMIITATATTNFLDAQDLIIDIKSLSVEDGLSSRVTSCVLQDYYGFVWIGTAYGLNRYDGYSNKVYQWKENDDYNHIYQLYNAPDSLVWIQDGAKNIRILHPLTQEIQSFEDYFGEQIPFDSKQIAYLFSTDNQCLFIRTVDGFYYKYTYKKKWIPCWKGSADLSKALNYIYSIDQQSTWLHEGDSCYYYNNKNQCIQSYFVGNDVVVLGITKQNKPILYEVKEDFVQLYTFDKQGIVELKEGVLLSDILGINIRFNQSNRPHQLYLESYQLLWLENKNATYLYNLAKLPPQLLLENNKNSKFFPLELQSGLYKPSCLRNRIVAIGDKVYLLNFSTNQFKKIPKNSKENLSSIRSIITDRQHQLYIQSYNKGYFWKKTIDADSLISLESIIEKAEGAGLSSILSKDGQTIWMGTENAKVIEYHLPTQKTTYYQSCEGEQPAFKLWAFWSLYENYKGDIWVGSRDGIFLLDKTKKCLVPYDKFNGFELLKTSQINHFYTNDKGLWALTNTGLYLIDEQKGVLARYHSKASKPYFLPFDNLIFVHERKDGTFWIATKGGGVIHFDSKTGDYKQYTKENGLSHERVHVIYEDDFNNLWMSSDYGLMQMDLESKIVKTYLPSDGLPHEEFNINAHHQDSFGNLYFGTLAGVVQFHPKDFSGRQKAKSSIPFWLTHCTKWDIEQAEVDLLSTVIRNQTINLYPNDVFLTIRFALLDYQDVKNHQYAYKIEGFIEDWMVSNENFIRLSSLPSGEYKLLIKGRSNLSTWQDNIITIRLVVHAPFYKTGWFWVLTLVFVAFFVAIYYRMRIQKLSKDKIFLEETVHARTKEIEADKRIIQQQAEELQIAVELKSTFFTNISHEIRTPLTLILGPVQHLLEQALLKKHTDKQTINTLQVAYQNSQKLKQLVDEILLLSKLDVNKLEVQAQNICLYPFLQQVFYSFETMAEAKNVDYQFNYTVDENFSLYLDWKKLEKILYNLLSNAFKFVPDNNGQILLKGSLNESNNLVISVVDNGQGIQFNDLNHVFDRYYQTKESNSTNTGGTGIGLALSKELATLLDGKLDVYSVWGEGATFQLTIAIMPCITGDVLDVFYNNPINTNLVTIDVAHQFNKKQATILLVEDNVELQNYVEGLLSNNYNVIKANDGQEAFDLLKAKKYEVHLIISDIMMPRLDGYQLSMQLKNDKDWCNTPIIILSAKATQQDKLTALRIGVDDYLVKPFDASELLVRVQNLLSNYQQRQLVDLEKEINVSLETTLDVNVREEELSWLANVEELAIEIIKKEAGNFNLPDFAEKLQLSERQFRRRIKALVGLSPNDYLRELKLQIARTNLEQNTFQTVQEVAKSVGFTTATHFSKLYEQRFGKRPVDYFS